MAVGAQPDGPFYVPPPPPRWLIVAVILGLLGIAGAVAADVVSGSSRSTATVAVSGADLAALTSAVEEPSIVSSSVAPDELAADDSVPDANAGAEDADESGDEPGDDGPDGEPGSTADLDSAASSGDRAPPPAGVWVDPASSGQPWSALGSVEGLLTFRGSPTRSFHGRGPVPSQPEVQWSVNLGCSTSFVGSAAKEWCGTGWTGQPLVFRPPTSPPAADDDDAGWWVAVGGYNRAINFFDPANGQTVYPPFVTGDIIKGTATVDPDGFPLLYTGSRDNSMHIVALDRAEPTELWALSSEVGGPTLWNNDWDGSPMIIDDLMIVGGENSRFYVVKLNRGYDADGLVDINPELVASVAGWDQELLDDLGDVQVSIENSVAVSGSIVYFANSGGLIQGWDLGPVATGGEPERVFRFWVGDDVDASIVIDGEGQLYVGAEYERGSARAQELGQIFRLDPSRPDDPVVWSIEANRGLDTGVWATPALYNDLVLVASSDGRVLGLDRTDGSEQWSLPFDPPLWSSPVVVDDTLIQADCTVGLRAFDLTPARPRLLWTLPLDGCVESTPAVWDGQIFVGDRAGFFYGIGDAGR